MKKILLLAALCASSLLAGCGVSATDLQDNTVTQGQALKGTVFGGQQPIVGAHIYLYTVGTTGYASAATSIMTSGAGSDALGYYVLTTTGGNFSVTSTYSCTANSLVYIIAQGGDPGIGTGTNSTIMQVAVLGVCPSNGTFYGAIPSIMINEGTTVAAAYALAPFATDATHIGSTNTTQAKAGIAAAFQNAQLLVNSFNGYTLSTTPASTTYASASGLSANGTVPTSKINSIANIIAACVNSTGVGGSCSQLFGYTPNASGVLPTDEFTAVLNMAKLPAQNVSSLFLTIPANSPFYPGLSAVPNDWTLSIAFTAPNTSTPKRSALDTSGNLWIPNSGNNTLTELNSVGNVVSGTTGFSGGSTAALTSPQGLAIQPSSGNVVVANGGSKYISVFTSSGTASTLYGPAALNFGTYTYNAVAFDSSSTPYFASSSGIAYYNGSSLAWPLSIGATTGYGAAVTATKAFASSYSGNSVTSLALLNLLGTSYSGTLSSPTGLATDPSSNLWIANYGSNSISFFPSASTTITTNYTGAGMNTPWGVAVDGLGNALVSNGNGTISMLTSTGAALSPATGFTTGSTAAIYSVAVDNSGSVWAPCSDGKVYKFIGLAAPVSLPLNPGTLGRP